MPAWRSAVLTCVALLALGTRAGPANGAPAVPNDVREASPAIGYDPRGRCPDLMPADPQDGSAALVLLVVGSTGVPSHASIRSSSGSESLDAAAVSCVMRLRFLPAVHAGDGTAMDSWQVIAWKWGRSHTAAPGAAGAGATAVTAATGGAVAGGGAAGGGAAGGTVTGAVLASPTPPAPRSGAGAAEVRVCVDATGKLTQEPVITRTSGDLRLDEAALRIARSGAPYYRPAAATPVSGCAQLAIRFENQ
jgi:TonB family protein